MQSISDLLRRLRRRSNLDAAGLERRACSSTNPVPAPAEPVTVTAMEIGCPSTVGDGVTTMPIVGSVRACALGVARNQKMSAPRKIRKN